MVLRIALGGSRANRRAHNYHRNTINATQVGGRRITSGMPPHVIPFHYIKAHTTNLGYL